MMDALTGSNHTTNEYDHHQYSSSRTKSSSPTLSSSPSKNTSSSFKQQPATSFDSMFKFNYNTRIAITLIPATLLVLFLRGRSTIYISAIILFINYLVDLLNLPYLTLSTLWIGLFCIDVSVISGGLVLVQHSLVNIFLLFNIAMLLALIGVWMTLQFKWVTTQFPNLSTACERILFGSISYPVTVVFTWFTIILNGIELSPFYLLCFLSISYYLYIIPLRSFGVRSSKQISSVNDYILGRLESGLMTITLIFLPCIFYISIYHSLIFESDIWLHLSNIALLITIPATLCFLFTGHGSLWWIIPSFWNAKLQKRPTSNQFNIIFKFGSLIKMITLGILVAAVEYRVINNFYYTLRLHSTIAQIAVTLAMYSGATIFYLVAFSSPDSTIVGHIPTAFKMILYGLAAAVSVAVSYLLSVPIYLYPLAIAASLSFTVYLFHTALSLAFYVFLACSTCCLQWFIYDRLYFIDYHFFYPNISIQAFTYLITLLYVCGMLSMRFASRATTDNSFKLGLSFSSVLTSFLLAAVETILHTSDPMSYPIYIIYFTSILLIFVSNRLHETRSISFIIKVLVDCFAISKALATTMLPPSNQTLIPCSIYTFLIYSLVAYSGNQLERKHALNHALASFIVSLFYSDIPLRLLTLFINIDNPTSTAMQIASVLLSFAICIFNLSFKFYPQNKQLRNAIVLLFTSGALLLILNPSTSGSNQQQQQQQQRFIYSNWLLVSALITSLLGAIYRIRISKSSILKILFALTFGTLIGLYFSINYFTLNNNIFKKITKTTNEWIIHTMVTLIFNNFSVFIMYAFYPSLHSPRYMNALYTFFVTLFPITYILLGSVYGSYQSLKVLSHLENARLSIVSLAVGLNLLIVLYLKHYVSTAKSYHHSRVNTQYTNSPLKKQVGGSSAMRPSTGGDDGWVFSISSFACIFSYILAVAINMIWLGGSEICIFVLSPLLLLLNTERGTLKKFSETHRYAPMLFAISILLTVFAFIDTLAVASNTESSYEWYRFFGLSSGFWRMWWNLKNWILLMTTLPSVFYINRYLWKFERQSQYKWLIFSPPAILAILFSDIFSINLLGLIGIVGALSQKFISSQLQKRSNQVI